ncbi:MAG TPA: hypothetical protein VMB52_01285 [Verrucomicrobiae bacterium]|nr:hypothetical protein [Verrucomicrobiae bacterium]
MSEHEQAHVVASVDKGVMVGTKRSRRYRTHLKAFFIGVCLVAVIGIVGICGYELLHHHAKKANQSTMYVPPHFSSLAAAEQAATNASANGQFSHALAMLQSVITMAVTNQEKSNLYIQLASTAQNADNIALAIQYYQKRHTVDPSTVGIDSYSLAELYQRADEDSQAIVQYQNYITYVQANPSAVAPYSVSSVVTPIDAQIQSLESKK